MIAKPVLPCAEARADVDSAVEHYTNEAGADVAFSFIDAFEQAYTFIIEMGSPRWSHELNLPGLRSMRLKGFPWLIFYLELETHVDVWRVLHSKRDVTVWLSDADD